jgi:flagellar basal body-associated protein FliL
VKENIDTIIAKYGQKVPKKPRKSRVVILSIIILLVIAGITIGALILFMNKAVTPAVTPSITQTFNGPASKAIVDQIAADTTITGAKNYFVSRTNAAQSDPNSDMSSIVYQESGYPFITNVTAEDGLRFTLADGKGPSSKTVIATAMTTVLKNEGFTETSQDTGSLSSYATVTYVNSGTVCQIVDYSGTKQSILEQGVLCVSHAGLETTYNNVKTLLTKADPTIVSTTKSVQQTTVTSGTKKLLTLTVQPKNTSDTTRYYFAALDQNYEFIGSRPTPSVDNEASYTLSDQLKKNIADPKWGTFLSGNIKS